MTRVPKTARATKIPDVVIDRLPVYIRCLTLLRSSGREVVSSTDLARMSRVTPAQIRKDLSYFGRFGKQGRGYNVSQLLGELWQILGLNRQWRMVLVGVGKVGRAILEYDGFASQGFHVVQAFDVDHRVVGQKVASVTIRHVSELEQRLVADPVDIGIVTVPAAEAQTVVDILVRCGVKAILNYAPLLPHRPPEVELRQIDPVLALQSMAFHLRAMKQSPKQD
ncbi:MAG: redox-sensing transcriptional repressor Rex [Dehalococcoidia bacterium]